MELIFLANQDAIADLDEEEFVDIDDEGNKISEMKDVTNEKNNEERFEEEYEKIISKQHRINGKRKRRSIVPKYLVNDYPKGKFIYDAKECDTSQHLEVLVEDLRKGKIIKVKRWNRRRKRLQIKEKDNDACALINTNDNVSNFLVPSRPSGKNIIDGNRQYEGNKGRKKILSEKQKKQLLLDKRNKPPNTIVKEVKWSSLTITKEVLKEEEDRRLFSLQKAKEIEDIKNQEELLRKEKRAAELSSFDYHLTLSKDQKMEQWSKIMKSRRNVNPTDRIKLKLYDLSKNKHKLEELEEMMKEKKNYEEIANFDKLKQNKIQILSREKMLIEWKEGENKREREVKLKLDEIERERLEYIEGLKLETSKKEVQTRDAENSFVLQLLWSQIVKNLSFLSACVKIIQKRHDQIELEQMMDKASKQIGSFVVKSRSKMIGRKFRASCRLIYLFLCKRFKKRKLAKLDRSADLVKQFILDNRLHLSSIVKKYIYNLKITQRFFRHRLQINQARINALTPTFLKIEELLHEKRLHPVAPVKIRRQSIGNSAGTQLQPPSPSKRSSIAQQNMQEAEKRTSIITVTNNTNNNNNANTTSNATAVVNLSSLRNPELNLNPKAPKLSNLFGPGIAMISKKLRNKVLYLWIWKLRRYLWFQRIVFDKQRLIKYKGKLISINEAIEINKGEYNKDILIKLIKNASQKRPKLTLFKDTTCLVIQGLVVRAHCSFFFESKGQDIANLVIDPDSQNSEIVKYVGRDGIEKSLGDVFENSKFPSTKGRRLFKQNNNPLSKRRSSSLALPNNATSLEVNKNIIEEESDDEEEDKEVEENK